MRHCSTTGRTLLVDFTFCGQPYTVASVYAPAAAAERQQYYTQELLPSLPAGRCLLVGGDFNCIAGQQDMAAGHPGQRTQGYWTGLRLVETEHQLYDVWRDLNPSSRAFTHVATTCQSAARLGRWLVSETLQAWVSREHASDRAGSGLSRRPPGVPRRRSWAKRPRGQPVPPPGRSDWLRRSRVRFRRRPFTSARGSR